MSSNNAGRGRRLVVGVVAIGLLATGCSGVGGADAARVGGASIGQDVIDRATDAQLAQTGFGDRAALNRQQLTAQVRHELVTDLAAAQGVTGNDPSTQEVIAMFGADELAAQLSVPAADVPLAVGLLERAALQGTIDANVVAVKGQALQVATVAEAQQLRAQLLGPRRADVLASKRAELQTVDMTSALPGVAQVAALGVFTAEPGDVMVITSAASPLVFLVDDVNPGNEMVDVLSLLQNNDLATPFALLLGQSAATSDVTVNPRFGRWDPVAVAVVE